MPDSPPYHYRIRFEKLPAMRFTGHLDLQRAWERTLRRARMPLAYTKGFTPHPRLSLAAALPLGCTSEAELAEIWLEADVAPSRLSAALAQAAPPGLRVLEVSRLPVDAPALQNQVVCAEYEVRMPGGMDDADIPARVRKLLEATSLPRERRGRQYDLRPLVEEIDVRQDVYGRAHLRLRLSARQGASGRPDEVLLALSLDPALADIHRTRLTLVQTETSAK